jgi:hypothetical protein
MTGSAPPTPPPKDKIHAIRAKTVAIPVRSMTEPDRHRANEPAISVPSKCKDKQ